MLIYGRNNQRGTGLEQIRGSNNNTNEWAERGAAIENGNIKFAIRVIYSAYCTLVVNKNICKQRCDSIAKALTTDDKSNSIISIVETLHKPNEKLHLNCY